MRACVSVCAHASMHVCFTRFLHLSLAQVAKSLSSMCCISVVVVVVVDSFDLVSFDPR